MLEGEHRLLLILTAPDQERVDAFMAFFAHQGEVQIRRASSADEAVARRGCQVDLHTSDQALPDVAAKRPTSGEGGAY